MNTPSARKGSFTSPPVIDVPMLEISCVSDDMAVSALMFDNCSIGLAPTGLTLMLAGGSAKSDTSLTDKVPPNCVPTTSAVSARSMSTSSGAVALRWSATTSSTSSSANSAPVRRPDASGSTSSTPMDVLIFAVPEAVASANPNCTGSETEASRSTDSCSVGRFVIANASGAEPTLGSNSNVIVVSGIVTVTLRSAPAMPTSSVEIGGGAVATRSADSLNVTVATPPLTAACASEKTKPPTSRLLMAAASWSVSLSTASEASAPSGSCKPSRSAGLCRALAPSHRGRRADSLQRDQRRRP